MSLPGGTLGRAQRTWRESVACDDSVPRAAGPAPLYSGRGANSEQGQLQREKTSEMRWSPESPTVSPTCAMARDVLGPYSYQAPSFAWQGLLTGMEGLDRHHICSRPPIVDLCAFLLL